MPSSTSDWPGTSSHCRRRSEARELLAHAERTRAAARTLADGVLHRLLLAAPTATISEPVAPFLGTLGRDEPLVLVRELSPLRVHVAPDHRWAERPSRTVELAELVEETLFLLPQDNTSRVELDLAVARAGLSYARVEECAVARVIQAHAAAGRGVGVVTDLPRSGAVSLTVADPRGPGSAPLHVVLNAAWDRAHFAAEAIASLADRIGTFLATVDDAG